MALYYNSVSSGTSDLLFFKVVLIVCMFISGLCSRKQKVLCKIFLDITSRLQSFFFFFLITFTGILWHSCDLLSVQLWMFENTSTLNSAQKMWLCNLYLHMTWRTSLPTSSLGDTVFYYWSTYCFLCLTEQVGNRYYGRTWNNFLVFCLKYFKCMWLVHCVPCSLFQRQAVVSTRAFLQHFFQIFAS